MEKGNAATDCGLTNRYSIVCPDGWDIAKAGELQFDWEVKDGNLNSLNATLRISHDEDGKGYHQLGSHGCLSVSSLEDGTSCRA